jgi:hypothetical protein
MLVNAFADDAYNRVSYTLVSPLVRGCGDSALPPLHRTAFGVVEAALEAVDFGAHAGAHPRLGVVDHIAFHPSLPQSPSAIRIAPPSESSLLLSTLPSSAEGEHAEPSIGAEAEQQMWWTRVPRSHRAAIPILAPPDCE